MWLPAIKHVRRNAIAYVALFLAIGGTSYAALHLPANSVGTKQLRNGAVTLNKIATVAQTALQGAQGPKGATGPQGPKGDPGSSATGFNATVPEDGAFHQELTNSDFYLGVTCKPNDGGFSFLLYAVNPLGLDDSAAFASLTNPSAFPFVSGGNVTPGDDYSLLVSSSGPQRALGTALVHVGSKVYDITFSVAMSGECFARAVVTATS
jgi:hypothetical protein